MDLTASIVPKSDQLNADDLMAGPVTVTIAKVSAGSAEQPVDVHLTEFPGRAFRPSKSMRRVMVAAWGVEASAYTGRRMTLYRDPTIRFGGMEVGGIRISHLSHIDKRLTLALTVTRGKRAPCVVDPLPDVAPASSRAPEPSPVDAWEPDPDATPEPLTDHTRRQMFAELTKHGITDAEKQRAGMGRIIGRPVMSRADLTEDDGRAIVMDLMARPVLKPAAEGDPS